MDETSQAAASSEKKELTDRREFVKKAGKVAITVPAVALLLSMKARSARADTISGLDTIGIK